MKVSRFAAVGLCATLISGCQTMTGSSRSLQPVAVTSTSAAARPTAVVETSRRTRYLLLGAGTLVAIVVAVLLLGGDEYGENY